MVTGHPRASPNSPPTPGHSQPNTASPPWPTPPAHEGADRYGHGPCLGRPPRPTRCPATVSGLSGRSKKGPRRPDTASSSCTHTSSCTTQPAQPTRASTAWECQSRRQPTGRWCHRFAVRTGSVFSQPTVVAVLPVLQASKRVAHTSPPAQPGPHRAGSDTPAQASPPWPVVQLVERSKKGGPPRPTLGWFSQFRESVEKGHAGRF